MLGFPPTWEPCSTASAHAHWSQIDDFSNGDIKLQWETSRFSWAYTLCRAYARTSDECYAEAFWQLLADWLRHNPPNHGVQWKCGQEAAFRIMALCFSFYTFTGARASTPERIAELVSALAVHASRITAYITYAQSQRNNHAITEAVGLWTIGLLFPELASAANWRKRGKWILETEAIHQIYPDGAYIQHSANYHRVMLHDFAWALRLGESNDDRLTPEVYERFRCATRFLHAITDPETGWAPNYGANDGALVLSLTDCAFPDMRPVLQSSHFLTERELLYPKGAWDEEMAWLHEHKPTTSNVSGDCHAEPPLDAQDGGCYTLSSCSSWAMLHAARYRDRPSQADQLHVDLWWRGHNVLCDPGTYSYNAWPPFEDGLAGSRYHNTVVVDSLDQMTRVDRFLWADWAQASRPQRARPPRRQLTAEHDGYKRIGVTHRRLLRALDDDAWIVVDDLLGSGEHNLRLHWLIPDVSYTKHGRSWDFRFDAGTARIVLAGPGGAATSVVRGGQWIAGDAEAISEPDRGWCSRYYNRLDPALSIAMSCITKLPARFITVIALGSCPEIIIPSSLDGIAVGLHPMVDLNMDVSERKEDSK